MTTFIYDGVSGPTPLAMLKEGRAVDSMSMLMGRIPGTIGEVSVVALLIGAAYLLYRKVITIISRRPTSLPSPSSCLSSGSRIQAMLWLTSAAAA